MYLGIEIGGTKLQLGLGSGNDASFVEFLRYDVDANRGADGIREQIVDGVKQLQRRHQILRIGFGFGGPINSETQVVTKSHQIEGWDGFPLGSWCREQFGLPIVLGNDCDSAALAEAKFGAGANKRTVFYVTVGTGIGGGFVIDGKVHGAGRPAASEIGHLRPGLGALDRSWTVESVASGWGIAAMARARLTGVARSVDELIPVELRQPSPSADGDRADLLSRCAGDLDRLTSRDVGEAAADGNSTALMILESATSVLGWAIAQVITILAPEVVVVGGGVSLMGERLFFEPLRRSVGQFVFGPSSDSYEILPAQLGEEVVVHGAVALAASGE